MPIPALGAGQLHEIHAGVEDWASALAFATTSAARDRPIMLLQSTRRRAGGPSVPYGEGWLQLGLAPSRLVLVRAPDDLALLQAALDAARCPQLAAVVLESWGDCARYDLTASRRLVLAAEKSALPVIMLRGDASPRSSAAHSRWAIRSQPSVALAGVTPGLPVIEAELLRHRGGTAGLCWQLQWNENDGCFREIPARPAFATPPIKSPAPLSGAVVSLAALRSGDAGAWQSAHNPAGNTAGTLCAGDTDGQCAAAGSDQPGQRAAGAEAGHDPGRCTGPLPGTADIAA